MLSSHPHQNSLQFRCDIQINFLEPGMYCYKPLLFLFAFRFEPKYKHIQHIHGFVIDVECKYIKSMPVTWMELNHTTQPQTHFISINMRHLGTKIRDKHFPAISFKCCKQQTVKTFGDLVITDKSEVLQFLAAGMFQFPRSIYGLQTGTEKNMEGGLIMSRGQWLQ